MIRPDGKKEEKRDGHITMNVLLLTTISGFLPKFLMQDVRILMRLGYTVHYASNFEQPVYDCDRSALEKEGIICHSIPIAKNPLALRDNMAALRQLNKMILQYDIRAVHCHNPVGGVLGRLAGKSCRGRSKSRGRRPLPYIIYTAHGFHFYQGAPWKNWLLYYPVERILARRTDQLITINREDEILAKKFHLRKGGRIARIPGVGYDAARFCERPDKRKEFREELGAGDNDYIFLAVGELNDNKNHRTIIEAFAQMTERISSERRCIKLYICGEGLRRGLLQKRIRELSLEDRVFLCGYQTQIEKYYQCADCFLFPSVREGLGMAAVEAMACGLPLIVGDNRGTREYAYDNAIVCNSDDIRQFADAMQSVMEDMEKAAEMGRRSKEIAAGFSREKTDEVMEQVYERMHKELNVPEK